MAERWRLFVAIPIGEELRAALAASLDGWRSRPDLAGLRWTDPAAWHLTVHFLGATDPSDVTRIRADVAGVAAAHEPIQLATGGLGGFPSAGRARVAWYGVADPERRLRRLASEVSSVLAPEEPPRFRAHVTLARARSEPVDLRDWVAGADAPDGRLEIGEMLLMRSHLGRGPARHEVVGTVPLGGRVHA
jgi:2'-5' RNA ligase